MLPFFMTKSGPEYGEFLGKPSSASLAIAKFPSLGEVEVAGLPFDEIGGQVDISTGAKKKVNKRKSAAVTKEKKKHKETQEAAVETEVGAEAADSGAREASPAKKKNKSPSFEAGLAVPVPDKEKKKTRAVGPGPGEVPQAIYGVAASRLDYVSHFQFSCVLYLCLACWGVCLGKSLFMEGTSRVIFSSHWGHLGAMFVGHLSASTTSVLCCATEQFKDIPVELKACCAKEVLPDTVSFTCRNIPGIDCTFRVCVNFKKQAFWVYGHECEEQLADLKRSWSWSSSNPGEVWANLLLSVQQLWG